MNKRTRYILSAFFSIFAAGFAGCSDDSTGGSAGSVSAGSCTDSSQCVGDLVCIDGVCTNEASSGENNKKCGSIACSENEICDETVMRCAVPLGGTCGVGLSCANGLRCNPQKLVCQKAAGLGEDCANAFCEAGVCLSGRCTETAGDNALKMFDSDGDGISDYYEIGIGDMCGNSVCSKDNPRDSDGDTIPDYLDLDSNGDGIPDIFKSGTHGNIEKMPSASNPYDSRAGFDYLASDCDGNGIPDAIEAPYLVDDDGRHYAVEVTGGRDDQRMIFKDSSGTVIGNGLDPVTMQVLQDGVPVPGVFVHYPDLDGDGTPDFMDTDTDGDGIEDMLEIHGFARGDNTHTGRGCDAHCEQCDPGGWCTPGSPEKPWDTDGDTLPDYRSWDSDGDTIPDSVEMKIDSNGDGILDRYSLDSDGDTIPDAQEVEKNEDGSYSLIDFRGNIIHADSAENAFHQPMYYMNENGQLTACYQSADCDRDGLPDNIEVWCGNKWSGMFTDTDGDGYADASEYAAAQYVMAGYTPRPGAPHIASPADLICNMAYGVQDIFDFYFELPYGGPEKNDDLLFEPAVSKLDVVFNVDTTGSMTNAINNVKNNISNVISSLKKMVPDSGIGLTNFDDFPIGCYFKKNASLSSGEIADIYWPCGYPSADDLPFRLLGSVSTDADIVRRYTQDARFTTRNGGDGAESGAEALYQIATGVGTQWNAGVLSGYFVSSIEGTTVSLQQGSFSWPGGKVDKRINEEGTWGGVDFRNGSLPVVIHTTDVYSHDEQAILDAAYTSLESQFSYSASVVPEPHYSSQLIPVLQNKGIRVITLNVTSQDETHYAADALGQMSLWSRESNAIVPACAFEGACGNNKCCLGNEITDAQSINGRDSQCILAYKSSQTDVSETVVKGVDALVKYGTYDVSAVIRGEKMENGNNTACFLKKVEAAKYVAPPNEPERSCNPQAIPNMVKSTVYNDGFTNFAPGTSSADRKGAELHFTVYAQNDSCVEESDTMQVFRAYIDVVNPTTGLVFGTRQVSIIVPAKLNASVN